jgi:hypothetical protein
VLPSAWNELEELVRALLVLGVVVHVRLHMSTGHQYVLTEIAKEAERDFAGWDVDVGHAADCYMEGVSVELLGLSLVCI